MWKERIDEGVKALSNKNLVVAEGCFKTALEFARETFAHTDERIPQTFSFLGQALLWQKKIPEATEALRQSVRIARNLHYKSSLITTADYLWAYIDQSAEDAAERRKITYEALKREMPAPKLELLLKELNQLFAASKDNQQDERQEDTSSHTTSDVGETNNGFSSITQPEANEPVADDLSIEVSRLSLSDMLTGRKNFIQE
jgi:hypothetical protein